MLPLVFQDAAANLHHAAKASLKDRTVQIQRNDLTRPTRRANCSVHLLPPSGLARVKSDAGVPLTLLKVRKEDFPNDPLLPHGRPLCRWREERWIKMRAPKLQVKRKFVAPADSTEEDTPSKQQRTGGIKRSAVKPSAAKKLIKSASPSRSSSATEIETQPDKTEDVSLGPAATKAPVEDISAEGDGSNSAPLAPNLPMVLHPPQRPNELIDLSLDKENTPTPVASPARHVHVDDIESVAADVPMIDDDLENELLAQLDMLMDTPTKSRSATDSKGKAIAEKVDFDINLPTQEQITAFEAAQILSRAPQLSSAQQKFWADFTSIYTHFSRKFRVFESKVAAADSVRKFVADSTAAVLKKKEEFLAAKEAHVTQITHVQGLKEKISNLEAKLSELRNQVPLAEQSEKSLAEQRNKLRVDMEVGLKSAAKIKEQLPSFTASADEATKEIKNMREEWSSWQNNLC
ncbi:hypothetical protein SLEP1_g41921 [Rubroshorea leprosula]|uniref:Uncharacterized protein n=1 Tax=Rubroshorea leprosula TaxID=152421 RepID=A0AAV5L9G2_9ROSI|nr:hypothetical protein SLEP1_g41921 [Rubroshorea leprosula]